MERVDASCRERSGPKDLDSPVSVISARKGDGIAHKDGDDDGKKAEKESRRGVQGTGGASGDSGRQDGCEDTDECGGTKTWVMPGSIPLQTVVGVPVSINIPVLLLGPKYGYAGIAAILLVQALVNLPNWIARRVYRQFEVFYFASAAIMMVVLNLALRAASKSTP
jgi:hypothetical protein